MRVRGRRRPSLSWRGRDDGLRAIDPARARARGTARGRGGDLKAAAVVVAAGAGVRFGPGARKQFRELGGRPVLAWACRSLRASPAIGELVVVLPPEVLSDPPAWIEAVADRLVEGGPTRRDSVRRGLDGVDADAEAILVHDGARPFAGGDLVERIAAEAPKGPVVPGLSIEDSVKEVEGERIVRTVDRARLVRVQTPQGFPASLLRRLHAEARRDGTEAKDDAELCERAGVAVRLVPGEPWNLKITTREDLELAAWVLDTGRAPIAT